MRTIYAILFLWILTTGFVNKARAGEEPGRGTKRYTISGNIRDKSTGEELLGATVMSRNNMSGLLPIYTDFIP